MRDALDLEIPMPEPGPRQLAVAASGTGVGALRSQLLRFGPQALGDAELLALLLRGRSVRARAHALLDELGGLAALGRVDAVELARGDGLGPASAAAVAASLELARRMARARHPWATPLRRPGDVAEYVRAELRGADREHFLALGLDARQRVLLVRTVAIGSLAQVDVHPRELFRPMVRAGVHAVVLVHNHPSGDPRPSDADIELTHRMAQVGRLLGIPVLDHLVVSDDESVSLASLGMVPK